jgi:hypothetical protein
LDDYSDAEILVIIDDDACLLDHVRIEDIYNIDDGKIQVRGIEDPRRAGPRNHIEFIQNEFGMKFIAHFMTDFPNCVFSAMLPDLRAWMVRRYLQQDLVVDKAGQYEQIVKVLHHLKRFNGGLSEFNMIYHFAYHSPRWRERYEFLLSPSRITVGLSTHEHGMGCPPTWTSRVLPVNAATTSSASASAAAAAAASAASGGTGDGNVMTIGPESYLFYPNNMQYRADVEGGGFRSVSWKPELVRPIVQYMTNKNKTTFNILKEKRCQSRNTSSTADCWNSIFQEREGREIIPSLYMVYPDITEDWRKCFRIISTAND